jgi:signal transduction histidine kinase/DNA-binding NarL/FixJ family response regulator
LEQGGTGRTIGELVTTQVSLAADVSVATVVAFFEAHPDLDAIALVSTEGAVVGFVSRSRLLVRLSQRFGYAIYERRPIQLLMETPVVVEASADPLDVIHEVLCRPSEHAFDDFVVADDGRYVGLVSMRALLAHHKQLLMASLAQATSLDRRARDLEEQVSQMQKMEAVGRLAGGIAHDFNNLLSVIMGYAESLRRQLGGDPQHGPKVEGILAATNRAAGVTRQLLAFSRKQVIQPRVLDLNAVITQAGQMLGRLIGEHVALRLDLAPRLPKVLADPGQLEQVLMNLVVNARDAMPEGGTLTIATRAAGGQVAVEITDTGGGMSEATRRRIFEPFFTTKGVGKGTGLGLSTVFGIVTQAGGRIEVNSELHHGTTFTLYWPATGERLSSPEPSRSRPAAGGNETILLVEDEPEVRAVMAQSLSSAGYRVLEAATPDEALWLARVKTFDLLLTDVVMPGLSGRSLAFRIAALRPQTPVLYVSGYTDDILSEHGVLPTDVALLEKPFSTDQLLTRVREVLSRRPSLLRVDAVDRRRAADLVADEEERRARGALPGRHEVQALGA